MIYTDMTKKAMKTCFNAHKNQTDKDGIPYVFHPFHVAEQMKDEITTTVALLHDVVEDSAVSFDDLKNEGFPDTVIEALRLLTHDKEVPYLDYVAKVKQNAIARSVKLADLEHNSDLSRLSTITEKDRERVEKYKDAMDCLLDKNGTKEGIPYPDYVDVASIQCENYGYSDRKYRFKLRIPFVSARNKGDLRVIMKNPSTANEMHCDQTLLKVCGAAYHAGYSGIIILNLFPFRATLAPEVYREYFKDKKEYDRSMEKNYEVIGECCKNEEVVFAWGTNTISSAKEFQRVYDDQADRVKDIVLNCASKASGTYINKKYPLHGLRWWKTILVDGNDEKEPIWPMVVHHNMYGPACEVENCCPDQLEIFCYKEKKVCKPEGCQQCRYAAGDEEGRGKACMWPDPFGDESVDGRVIQHSERFNECRRVEMIDIYADEFEDFDAPIIACIGMSPEQAANENKSECLSPSLPNPKETYFKLDNIPDNLCISKQKGWAKEICAYKKNMEQILEYLYPEGIDIDEYRELLKEIDGEMFYIYGYGD